MVDRYEALGRLSQLKADGVLTEAEFDVEKVRLLASDDNERPAGKPARSGGWNWKRGALVGVAVGGIFAITRIDWVPAQSGQRAASAPAERLTRCDTAEARAALTSAFEHSAAERLASLKVLDLSNIVERSYDDNKPERICAADVTLNAGRQHTGFRIYPTSAGDNFIVETIDDPGPPPVAVASAEPAPVPTPIASSAPATDTADEDRRELWRLEEPTPTESAKLTATYPTEEAAIDALGSRCGVAPTGPFDEVPGYKYNGAICDGTGAR